VSGGWGESDADFDDLFEEPFFILEFDVKLNLAGRRGNYRFYVWRNGADQATFDNPAATDEDNRGLGVSLDQQLIGPLAAFFRWGMQDGDDSAVDMAWSTGLEVQGTWWRRPHDAFAVAVGQALLSTEFKHSAAAPLDTATESFFETYYRVALNDNIALSAHLQMIDNPGGNADLDTITILAGCLQVNL
jgi:high affinity Mn2+ porin